MRHITKSTLSSLLILFNSACLFSQDYIPDSLFGTFGFGSIPQNINSRPEKIFILSDGSFLSCNFLLSGANPGPPINSYEIAKYNSCGIPDSSYGENGHVIIAAPPYEAYLWVNSQTIDEAENIYLAGYYFIQAFEESVPVLVKIGPNGNSIQYFQPIEQGLNTGSTEATLRARFSTVKIEADDKITCFGSYFTNEDGGLINVRYKADGNLDSTYFDNGIKLSPLGISEFTIIKTLTFNDSLLHLARGVNFTRFGIKTANENQIDSTYGVNGVMPFPDLFSFLTILIELQDNKIINVLHQPDGIQVKRYLLDGNIDTTFGTNGLTIISEPIPPPSFEVIGIDILENNKIIIGSYSRFDIGYGVTYMLTHDGYLDSTFNESGYLELIYNDHPTAFCEGTIAQNGKLVLFGGNLANNGSIITRLTDSYVQPNITFDGAVLYSNVDSDFVNYQWFYNENQIENSNSSSLFFQGIGNYTVSISDTNGCGNLSDSIYIATVDNSYSNNLLQILSPNPADNWINLVGDENSKTYNIYNYIGELIQIGSIETGNTIIDISHLPNGIYYLNNNLGHSTKFIKVQ